MAKQAFVPVFDVDGKTPLMPTKPQRAAKWVATGEATPFWKRGIWCIRMNRTLSGKELQKVVVGIDPGSKMIGITVASSAHTYLNIQAHAKDGKYISDKVTRRTACRRARRYRSTPYRQCRPNRRGGKDSIPPSTKARWQWMLNLLAEINKSYVITDVVVEDVRAGNLKKGNHFNVVQVGKNYFYSEIRRRYVLYLYTGWQTANMRSVLGLDKDPRKLETNWNVHCVDSYCLCYWQTACKLDNKYVMVIKPLSFHRRQLHVVNFLKGGKRREYGGTVSMGIKRGTLVKHIYHGLSYVGGTSKGRVSLHSMAGKRFCQNAKVSDLKIKKQLTFI